MDEKKKLSRTQAIKRAKDKPQVRFMEIERDWINPDDRTITVPISSETPVQRWWGPEILEHGPETKIDLERVKNIGSFLFAHGRDPQQGWTPLGPVVNVWLKFDERRCWAVLKFDEDERSEMYWKKVQSGSLKGISIRYAVNVWAEIEPGKMSRGFNGPASVAIDWEIIEISLEPTPADPNVGGGRSEDDFFDEENQEERKDDKTMDEQNKNPQGETQETRTTEVPETQQPTHESQPVQQTPTESQRTALDSKEAERLAKEAADKAIQQERERVTEITSMCRQLGLDSEVNGFVSSGAKIEEVRKAVIQKMTERQGAIPTVQVVVAEQDKFRNAVVDGLSRKLGYAVEKPAEGADSFRNFSILSVAAECLERHGLRTRGLSKEDLAREILNRNSINGTADFQYIMANVAHKAMMQGVMAAPTTFQLWTKKGNLTDFKLSQRNQLSEAPSLLKVGENGEYKHGEMKDHGEFIKLETFGRLFTLSRQAIINDELSAFADVPQKLGAAARRLVNHTVYGIFKDNPKMNDDIALFNAKHSNLAATAADITIDSLDSAITAMATQKNLSGEETLNVIPQFLLVPIAKRTKAKQLISSVVDPTKNNATPNPFANDFDIISDAELDAISATAWYLAAAPVYVDTVEVAYLNGDENPRLDQQVGFEVDGITYKVSHDFGVKALNYRGLYKNAGA